MRHVDSAMHAGAMASLKYLHGIYQICQIVPQKRLRSGSNCSDNRKKRLRSRIAKIRWTIIDIFPKDPAPQLLSLSSPSIVRTRCPPFRALDFSSIIVRVTAPWPWRAAPPGPSGSAAGAPSSSRRGRGYPQSLGPPPALPGPGTPFWAVKRPVHGTKVQK